MVGLAKVAFNFCVGCRNVRSGGGKGVPEADATWKVRADFRNTGVIVVKSGCTSLVLCNILELSASRQGPAEESLFAVD